MQLRTHQQVRISKYDPATRTKGIGVGRYDSICRWHRIDSSDLRRGDPGGRRTAWWSAILGGGVHFGAGGGAFAPPHIAGPRAPLTSPVAPQLSARPGHLLQRVAPGQVGSAPLPGSVRQIPRLTNQAANAFALSGVRRFGSAQI